MSKNWDKVKQSGYVGTLIGGGLIVGLLGGAALVGSLTYRGVDVRNQAKLCSICEGQQEECVAEWWPSTDIIDKCAKVDDGCK